MDMEMLEDHLEESLVRENAEGLTVSIQDRFSNLRREIIDTILVKLPIKDAARTSVLSRKWRYRWHSMSKLVFGRKSLIRQQSKCVKQQEDGWKKLARIVDQVLVVHAGPIREFSLVAGLPAASDVDRWLIRLMRVDISCLTLWFLYGRLRLSSHVFACELLDKLILHRCELRLPVSFREFPKLKSLKLCNVLVSDDGLGLLISNCPCLEQLVLLGVESCRHLQIYAPMLVKLILHGAFHDLCFAYGPELISANIGLSLSRDIWHSLGKTRSLDKVFGGIQTIKQLFMEEQFLQFLSESCGLESLTMKFEHLSRIHLDINFSSLKQTLLVISLFRSSPNLQNLSLKAIIENDINRPVINFWESQQPLDCSLDQLMVVEISDIIGAKHELQFIRFILANSPMLVTAEVTTNQTKRVLDEAKMFKELLRFNRASDRAQIIYSD